MRLVCPECGSENQFRPVNLEQELIIECKTCKIELRLDLNLSKIDTSEHREEGNDLDSHLNMVFKSMAAHNELDELDEEEKISKELEQAISRLDQYDDFPDIDTQELDQQLISDIKKLKSENKKKKKYRWVVAAALVLVTLAVSSNEKLSSRIEAGIESLTLKVKTFATQEKVQE